MQPQANVQSSMQPPTLIKPLVNKVGGGKKNLQMILIALVVVILGVGTGWLLSGGLSKKSGLPEAAKNVNVEESTGGIAGECKFDTVSGNLKTGGVDGEGTHHLEREGGPSQNVYLTSTVLDLESFAGKEVEVCGETMAGKEAGWLMDVVSVKAI